MSDVCNVKRPQHYCPVCRTLRALTTKGVFPRHRRDGMYESPVCAGSGRSVPAHEAWRSERRPLEAATVAASTALYAAARQRETAQEAATVAQRAAWEQSEREQGLGRRGPYWRPTEARVGMREVDTTRVRRAYRPRPYEDGALILAGIYCGDPLATRAQYRNFSLHWRAYDHAAVFAHLREPVVLP